MSDSKSGPAAAGARTKPSASRQTNATVASPSFQLTDEIKFLPGVGPKRAEAFARLGIRTIADLLEYVPMRHERTEERLIENLDEGMIASVVGQVTAVKKQFGHRGGSVSATLTDNSARCGMVWFNAPWMADRIKPGMIVRATGTVREFRQLPQLVNPKIAVLSENAAPANERKDPSIAGVYPATAMLTSEQIARLISTHLERMLSLVNEWHSLEHQKSRDLRPRRWALEVLHRPKSDEDVARAQKRLAYDELFLLQLATQIARRQRASSATASALQCSEEIDRRIRARFPFQLTNGQQRAVKEISADLAATRPMNRMLQGDVGCGKTVVALYAALVAIANKMQVAIMAPTELLADQHARSIEKYLAGSRVRHALLVGGMKAADRREMVANIANGKLDLVVGTHALIQEDVQFDRLGLVVIDEQHRFGVRQRATFRSKGIATDGGRAATPHYLVMTATPIPRTLAMTVFGDLDVTTIDELPPGRSAIHTRLVTPVMKPPAWEFIRQRLAAGEQAYVVYPLIDESDKVEAKAATVEFERLRDVEFRGHKLGLLHGRMSTDDREKVMADFAAGRVQMLVATTVIEVGIDVANATCMVVEHAERYGLSQLHQLRGRVGRGSRQGHCLLMTASAHGAENERLAVLVNTTDGFRIAEEDLRIRGPGEMLGVRQHGLPELRVADLVRDADLLREAQRDAGDMIREDAQLRNPERSVIRTALLAKYGDRLGLMGAG